MKPEQSLLLDKARKKATEACQTPPRNDAEFEAWREYIKEAVRRCFGGNAPEFKRLSDGITTSMMRHNQIPTPIIRNMMIAADVGVLLDSIAEIASDFGTLPKEVLDSARRATAPPNNRVFLVHGRDELWKERVARFLQGLGLEVTILGEQAGQGRTIIEKIEHYADVGVAVVLLTADDVGALSGEVVLPRARQNVVFEAGYFIGKLGRPRVIPMMAPDVEEFSDLKGVNFISLDQTAGWKIELEAELRASGLIVSNR